MFGCIVELMEESDNVALGQILAFVFVFVVVVVFSFVFVQR